jgi:VWFA-related protein
MTRLLFAALLGAILLQQDPQRPVFRAGAHFVRVDAYPLRDGRPIPGLKAQDFQLLEDGAPQTIETLEYVEFEGYTPETQRQDPNSQRDAFEQAKDPSYRVFVLYLDIYHVTVDGSHRIRQPIINMLNRMLGPKDLFGVLTPIQTPKDLILQRQSLQIQDQLNKYWYWGTQGSLVLEQFDALRSCFPQNQPLTETLVALTKLDKVYADLEGLVRLLGDLREEKKQIVFFANGLPSPPSAARRQYTRQERPNPGGIGVDGQGKLTAGARNASERDARWCEGEFSRLTSIDFDRRFRDLLASSRQANVSFYPVAPVGLEAPGDVQRRSPGGARELDAISARVDSLLTLAEETDGVAVVRTNDLNTGLQKVAADLSSYYVLGYYTSNTKWNGASRKITVKLKSTGETIRARREYRAPTADEMESMRAARAAADNPAAPSPVDTALTALTKTRPGATFYTYGVASGSELAIVAELSAAEVEAGRWKQGAEVQVLLNGKNGESAGGKGRIDPGARGAIVRVPIGSQSGPWEATVRLKGDEPRGEFDTVAVARSTAAVLGDPIAYRAISAATAPLRPIAAFHFRRTERLRIEWPLLKTLDSREVRVLDRNGNPTPHKLVVEETTSPSGPVLAASFNLAPVAAGDYAIEVHAKAGAQEERRLVAIRVSNAR